VVGIQHLAGLVRGEEGIHLRLVGNVDSLHRMGEDESVHAHHDRERELLGQSEGLDMEVGGFLVGLGEELDPPRIPHGHGVAVVVPDVDRGPDGPIG
jgi:hypothetical protein